MLALLLVLATQQDPSSIVKSAQQAIEKIGSNPSDESLRELFEKDYVPSIDWEPGLMPVLIEGLKIDSHPMTSHISQVWPKVAGFELMDLGCGTPDILHGNDQKKPLLDAIDKWWANAAKGSRVDWYLRALESGDSSFRRTAIDRLSMMFNQSFGYEFEAPAEARTKAVEVWRAWWKAARGSVRWSPQHSCYLTGEVPLPGGEKRPSAEDMKALLDQLKDDDLGTRETAMQRLIDAGPDADGPLKRLAASDDEELRSRALFILEAHEALSKPLDPAIREKAAAILCAHDQAGAIAALAAAKDITSAAILVEVCNDRRCGAEAALEGAKRAAGDPRVAWAFARWLRRTTDDTTQTRYGMAYYAADGVLALFSKGASLLVPHLKDASPRVRMGAAVVLVTAGNADAVKAGLGDGDPRVRGSTIRALQHSKGLMAGEILRAHFVAEKDSGLRTEIVRVVGRLKDESALEWLGKIAGDRRADYWAPGAAAESIGEIGSTRAIAMLRLLVEVRKADMAAPGDEYSRLYVIRYLVGSVVKIALKHPGHKESWAMVQDLFTHQDAGLRERAVERFGWAETAEVTGAVAPLVRELLQGAAADKSEKVRELARTALNSWK